MDEEANKWIKIIAISKLIITISYQNKKKALDCLENEHYRK